MLSELLLQTLSGELLRPSPSTSYLLLLLLLHSVLLILNSISLSRIRLKVVCCPRSAKVGDNGQAVAGRREGGCGGRGLPIIQVSPIVVVVQLPDGDFLQMNVVHTTRRELHITITSYHFTL